MEVVAISQSAAYWCNVGRGLEEVYSFFRHRQCSFGPAWDGRPALTNFAIALCGRRELDAISPMLEWDSFFSLLSNQRLNRAQQNRPQITVRSGETVHFCFVVLIK